MNRVTFREDRCKGCELCVNACPKHIIAIATDRLNAKGFRPAEIIDPEKCIGCGKCVKACEYGAVAVEDNLARISPDKCVACGACVKVCPMKCIAM